jgi:hypothetical protein
MAGNATTVFVFQQFDPAPVYHLPAWLVDGRESYRETEDGGEEMKVACGRVYSTYKPEGNQIDHAIRIRWDHARAIGRMCKDCQDLYYGADVS